MTTTSAIHARTTTADPGITLTATKVTTTGSRISRTSRRKVKDFNDSITCSLCSGYLIEATTINDCLHTFCRSCIVRHLEGNKYCPKCKSYNNKTITVANLRPDRILRSLVYKLVPGLHKSENQRAAKYYADQGQDEQPPGGSRKAPDHSYLDDQNFFSPDELINLSLEYHYDSIVDYDPKKQELPITYLCCPAAVTIHHLYKFILTKNGLQLDNERIQVDIIYEDEILPHEFTLMDVAYCFNYKRSSLMRLYYRIFIHPTAKPTATTTTYNVGSDKNSNENNKYSGGERDANNSTGRSSGANFNEPSQGSAAESSSSSSPSKPTSTSPSKNATAASSSDAGDKVSTAESKEADSQIKVGAVQDAAKSVNNEASKVSTEPSVKSSFQPTEASCYSKYDSKLIITKTNKSDKGGSEKKEKESLKLVLVPKKSDKNDAKIVYSKSDSKPSKSPKQSSPSAPVSFGDFKRLRSNDIRYSDYETSSSSSGVGLSSTKSVATSSNKSGTVPGNDSKKTESQNAKKYNKINNDYNNPSDSSGKKVSEDNSRNKVYGNGATNNQREGEFAPAQQVCVAKTKYEKSKPSPPRSENNGAPMAITASTTSAAAVGEKIEKSSELKCYVNLKKQMVVSPLSSSAETHRKEVPKLKIELPSLKTKITIPKPDSEKSPRSVHSSSTSSSAATSPTTSSSASGKSPMWLKPDDGVKSVDVPSIDIEEYAKTIGLKPVHKISSSEGGQKKKKKSSTSSSPDPSFHRKRKKAKHSKESGGKRRKLHAEISSQHDESLKMKVKLTEKPSKHERKPSEEITPQSPKEPTKHNTEVTPSSSLPAPPAPPPSALPLASPVAAATTMLTPPKEDSSKVIDITKGDDDDDVKIIEQPTLDVWPMAPANVTEKSTTVATRVNELPNLPSLCGSDSSTKAKINEMRAIRHKPMVYIPNLDKNLSDNSPTINNLIQSVQAKTGFIDKDNDVQIVSTSRLDGNALSLSKVPMPPLVPTKPISTVPSMKPPTVIPSTASGRMVSTNSIPKPQQRVTAQSQQVFSPRHTPSYPPLALQSAPKKVITPTTSNSTNVYQPRNMNPSLKRSISVDSNSTNNVPPKTPRVDLMELNSQNQFLKKPIYAPMFNFVKGASLAKNGNPNRLPTSANDVPYKSPISSSYTKEMSTKKPVPSLLLPPSSISVTKMTDTVPQPIPVDNRPALEIVRIPSTAPVADKPQTSPKSTSVTSKASRPPPPTIPLIKIKKSASVPEQPTSPISPSVFQVTSSSTNNSSKLSTTCASRQDTGGALDLTTRANDDLIILEGSDSLTPKLNGNETKPKTNAEKRPDIDSSRLELINSLIQTSAASMIKAGSGVMAKLQSSIPGLKLPPEMIGFAITSSSNVMPKLTVSSPSSGSTMTTTTAAKSIPMPKLAEINRNRNTAVRQLNPSVRSIPNPSALAFRNQTIAISSSSVTPAATSFASAVASVPSGGSTITSFSPTSPTTAARIMNVNMKTNNAANATTLAGQKSSVNNNGIGSVADTIPSIVSLAKTNTSTYGMGKSTTTTNGNGGASNAVSNLNGSGKNDNVSSTSNGGSGGSGSGGLGKKTIEKVAAGLKAAADAAAVVANGNRVSSSISSSNGNTGTGVGGGVSKNGVNVA